MTKVALIGSTGRVGRMVARAWHSNPQHPSYHVPLQIRDQSLAPSARLLPWDVHQGSGGLETWNARFGRVSCLVVLAGITPASGGDMNDNVTIAQRIVTAARAAGVCRVLIPSSAAVYGAGTGQPLHESDPCRPLNDYGRSKVDMENALREMGGDGLEICCLRIGNVLGADALFANAGNTDMLRIDQFAHGRGPLRSYIDPGTLADVLWFLANYPGELPFLLNVALSHPVYMDALAEASGLAWTFQPAPPTARANVVLDCHALEHLLPAPMPVADPRRMIADWQHYSGDVFQHTVRPRSVLGG